MYARVVTAMRQIEVKGTQVELTDEGFLAHPEVWTEEVATALAHAEEGVQEMTAAHWRIVKFIRQHYLQHGIAPMIRVLCKATGITLKRIFELFPSGPSKGACKVAGLPSGDNCV